MAKLSIVCAMAKNRVIGKDNAMPWHLPEDLQHFKALTTGKVIVMGRKTYDSIGRLLPNRTNVILSRTEMDVPGADCATNLDAVLVKYASESEVMIIGGANIYQQCIAKCTRMYLTYIDVDVAGDSFFPEFSMTEWQEVDDSGVLTATRTGINYRFVTLEQDK